MERKESGSVSNNVMGTIRPKILIIAPWLPKPDLTAGDLRFFAMLQILAKNNIVDFFVAFSDIHSPEVSRYTQDLQKIGITFLENSAVGLDLAVLRHSYDIVIFEFWHCADQGMDIIRRQLPRAQIVIDSVDIHFLREEAGLAFGISDPSTVHRNKQHEVKTYQQADLVVAVTQEDQDALVLEEVTTSLKLVPMIVPIRTREMKPRAQELLFIGGFNHTPNVDGLLWFVNECWASVQRRLPRATLTVVGSHPPPEILELGAQAGIKVVGFVPETAPYLDKACISIAPLRFGAGMKGKVTEAMAAGLPVVTTTFGAQGLNAVSGKHLMVADEPALFAEHIITLLSDPSHLGDIGFAGQDHIIQLCSAEVVEKQLNEIVEFLMVKTTRRSSFPSVIVSLGYRGTIAGKFALLCFKRLVKRMVRSSSSGNMPGGTLTT